MTEIEMQRAALQDMQDNKLPLDDDNTVKRLYRWFNVEYDSSTRIISSFSLNGKKVAMARRTSGFEVPDGCTPKYASRKKSAPRRGRPSKPKTTTLES